MNPILKFYYGSKIVEGSFVCDFCGHEDDQCEYNSKAKVAKWKCSSCDKTNFVENVEFNE